MPQWNYTPHPNAHFVAERAGPGLWRSNQTPSNHALLSFITSAFPEHSGSSQQGFSSCGAILFLFSFMDICINQGGWIEKGVHLLRHKSNENLASYVVFTQKSSKLSPGMEPGQATQPCQHTAIERGLKFGSKNLIPRSNLITFKCSFVFNYFSQHALSSPPSGARAVPWYARAWPEEHTDLRQAGGTKAPSPCSDGTW